MKTFNLVIDASLSGMRLDLVLVASELGLSRRRIRSIIDVGGVYINNRRVRIASRLVSRGDKVRVEYSEEALRTLKTQSFAFSDDDILFDDFDIVAVNKPPGVPAQATKDQSIVHAAPLLEEYMRRVKNRRLKPILVHRLDKETSGIMLLATTAAKATWLTDLFRQRTVEKRYLAICYGLPKEETFTERSYLSAIDKKTGNVRVVNSGGKQAVTHFRLLSKNVKLGISLFECRPETGRSHQIRVHLEARGLPIVGDKRYGLKSRVTLPQDLAELASVHHFLHAEGLRFSPDAANQKAVELWAQPPQRFAKFMQLADLKR